MSKKVLSVLLAVMLVFGVVSVASVAAADEDTSRRIYFQAPEKWQIEKSALYAYIWNSSTGKTVGGWQAPATELKMVVKGNREFWYIDVPAAADGDPEWDCVIFSIFSTSYKEQTYDTTFGADCFGKIAYMTDAVVENPVDSNQVAKVASWYELQDTYGPHIAVTSTGNVVGNFLLPGETAEDIVATFVEAHGPGTEIPLPDLITAEKQAEYIEAINKASTEGKPEASDPADTPKLPEPAVTTTEAPTNAPSSSDTSSDSSNTNTTEPPTEREADEYGRQPGLPLPEGMKPPEKYADKEYQKLNDKWDGYYRIYYFQAPDAWLANADQKPEGMEIGFYWYDGTNEGQAWPGAAATKLEGVPGMENVYYAWAPSTANLLVWNNGIDGGSDGSDKAIQAVDLKIDNPMLDDLGAVDFCGALAYWGGTDADLLVEENPLTGAIQTKYILKWTYFDPKTGETTDEPCKDASGNIVYAENVDGKEGNLNPYYDMDYTYDGYSGGETEVPTVAPTKAPVTTTTPSGKDGSDTSSKTNSSSTTSGKGVVNTADAAVGSVLLCVLVAALAVAYLARKRENA